MNAPQTAPQPSPKPNNDKLIVCPYCRKSIPGAERIGGTVSVRYNRDHLTFERGTMPCLCGARLIVLLGAVVESIPPPPDAGQ